MALFLCGAGPAAVTMAQAPPPESSAGPAVTGFNGNTVVAWAGLSGVGDHEVWYATYDGNWSPQASIPGANTMTSPALGVANGQIYLATTPADSNGEIVYYTSTGTGFGSNGTALCAGNTCAHTQATPALAGSGSTLYAAWTTANGAIMYAENINGVWRIAAAPLPNALTNPDAGPTLAVYDNALFVAWVTPSGGIEVESAPLPLTGRSWSTPTQVAAQTNVAPALGVMYGVGQEHVYALYLAWTTAAETLDFDYLDVATLQWLPTSAPVPLPNGPLTAFSPALNSHTETVPADIGASLGEVEPSASGNSYIVNSVGITKALGTPGQGFVDIFQQVVRPPP